MKDLRHKQPGNNEKVRTDKNLVQATTWSDKFVLCLRTSLRSSLVTFTDFPTLYNGNSPPTSLPSKSDLFSLISPSCYQGSIALSMRPAHYMVTSHKGPSVSLPVWRRLTYPSCGPPKMTGDTNRKGKSDRTHHRSSDLRSFVTPSLWDPLHIPSWLLTSYL